MKKKLIQFRLDRNLSQEDMAGIIDKSQSLYSRKENGQVPFDEFEIRYIKEYFNLSKEQIVELIFE